MSLFIGDVLAGVYLLALTVVGWNVRAETRASQPFGVGAFLFVLSLFPLGFGIAILTWSRG